MVSVDVRAARAARLGLVARRALRADGISARTIHRRLADGVWRLPCDGVVEVHALPWTWGRRALMALVAAPGGSVLSHASAAHVLGLGVDAAQPIHVTIPRPVRHLTVPGRTHTAVHPLEEVTVGHLRTTTVRRTLLDLAAAGSGRDLQRAVRTALGQGRVHLADLTDPGLAGAPGSRRLRLAAQDEYDHVGRRTESPLERDWVTALLGAGLGGFVTQHPVSTSDGGRWRLDVAWVPPRVVLEVDGRLHADALTSRHDADRTASLAEDGWAVRRVGAADLLHPRRDVVVADLRSLLADRSRRAAAASGATTVAMSRDPDWRGRIP